jgi:hypothetical protein
MTLILSLPRPYPYVVEPDIDKIAAFFKSNNLSVDYIDLGIELYEYFFNNKLQKSFHPEIKRILDKTKRKEGLTGQEITKVNFFTESYREFYTDFSTNNKMKDEGLKGHLLDFIGKNNDNFIIISTFHVRQLFFLFELIKLLKSSPGNKIVLLGNEEIFSTLDDKEYEIAVNSIDYFVYEDPLAELKHILLTQGILNSSTAKDNGKVSINSSVINFSKLPIPNVIVPLAVSFDCDYGQCYFCSMAFNKKTGLKINIGEALDLIEMYKDKYGILTFDFKDPYLPPGVLEELSEQLIKRKLNIKFFFKGRPEKEYSESILKLAYKAGARYVLWGVESGNQSLLDFLNKGTRLEEISETLKLSHHSGIKNCVYVMVGVPGESNKAFVDTMNFIKAHSEYIYYVRLRPFVLIKNTYIYNNPEKFKIRILDKMGQNDNPFVSSYYDTTTSSRVLRSRFYHLMNYCNYHINQKDYLPTDYHFALGCDKYFMNDSAY